MKKLPLALGLLLMFIGVIVTSSYNSSMANQGLKTEAQVNEDWSISANFIPGDNMTLLIAWSAITYGEDWGELPVNVTITANSKDTTVITVYFLANPDSPIDQEFGRQQLYVARLELLSNEGDSLEVGDPPFQIGGVAKQGGVFDFRVHPPPDSFPWAGTPKPNPPTSLLLLKVVITSTYPYRTFLPVGVTTGILGGVIILVSRHRENRGAVRKKKTRSC